jgi:hypothetical protein
VQTSRHEVACCVGVDEVCDFPSYEWAACEIAKVKALNMFSSMVEVLAIRTEYIVRRLYPICLETVSRKRMGSGVTVSKKLEQFVELGTWRGPVRGIPCTADPGQPYTVRVVW